MNFEKELKEIINDKKSGSSYIAKKVESLFPIIPETKLKESIKKILKAHSSMAAVINKINFLCLKKEGFTIKEEKESKIFDEFIKENGKRKNWITLSMSYWVIELFKRIKQRLNIKVGISYPAKEGLITYDYLSEYHNIKVYEDSRLSNEVKECDGIVLGADLITEEFVVNKIGSFPIALAAKYYDKPVYVISSGDKYLTKELLKFFRIKKRERGNRVIDIFEDVPIKLIDKIYLSSKPYKYPVSECLKNIEI